MKIHISDINGDLILERWVKDLPNRNNSLMLAEILRENYQGWVPSNNYNGKFLSSKDEDTEYIARLYDEKNNIACEIRSRKRNKPILEFGFIR